VASEGAVAAHKAPGSKDASGMKASDFFKALDAALGNKFNSLVLVFGGCFTGDFTKKAKTSAVGTSGKPVAVLAATDENETYQCANGNQLGNTFTNGVTDGLQDPDATTQSAFDLGKRRVSGGGADQTPTFTPINGGGGIKPGQAAASYHAILFVGKPTTCSDWNDLDKMYQDLINRGYPKANIDCYFGRGERGTAADDHTPVLSKEDYTAGSTVKHEASDPSKCPGFHDSGQTIKAATAENLKKALDGLKAIADAGANEQYFIWCADHSTVLAMATPSTQSSDGTALCSVTATVDSGFLAQQYIAQPATDSMGVVLNATGLHGSERLFLNGQPVATLDSSLNGHFQFYPVPRNRVSLGTNTISVAPAGFPFTVTDAAIESGEIPAQYVAPFSLPAARATGWATLAGALLVTGAAVISRSRRRSRP